MNKRLLILSGLGLVTAARMMLAESTNSIPVLVGTTNDLIITCTNDAEYRPPLVVFHGDVKVLEPRMYLECDLLTLRLLTNSPAASRQGGGPANPGAQLESIVAETNVMMMARDTTIIGDRAVYSASNEIVEVTGTLVIVETDKALMYATNF